MNEGVGTCVPPGAGVWVERAHAKVNLSLYVGAPRPDGFHPVATVLQTVALCDHIRIAWRGLRQAPGAEGPHPPPRLVVRTDDPALPQGRENLAGRALEALLPELARRGLGGGEIDVFIAKRIPVAAGLGGGSADAAAVLRGVNRALRLGLTRDALVEIAAGLGSDVPACLVGGTLFCRGRGERVTPLAAGRLWWVLAHPGGPGLSTKEVYATLDRRFPHKLRRGGLDAPLGRQAPGFEEALLRGDPREIARFLENDLEAPALYLAERLGTLLKAARRAGAVAALVSGSGPTVAMLTAGAREAQALAEGIRSDAAWVWWGPSWDGDQESGVGDSFAGHRGLGGAPAAADGDGAS